MEAGLSLSRASDPILRSHFRIGACMAIPAMAAGVGAAAIWKERTGEGQDVKIDLREAVYNTNPAIAIILQIKKAMGMLDPDDPLPENFTFIPTINGLWIKHRSSSMRRSLSPSFPPKTAAG